MNRLHHVGMVVASVEDAGDSLGPTVLCFHDEAQGVRVRFVGDAARGLVELIEPAGNDAIARFLDKGGGLHHLAFEVGDFDAACADMRKDAVPIGKPWIGFEGRRLAFFMPRRLRLLTELVGPLP